MQSILTKRTQTILTLVVYLLILKVTLTVVTNYRDYLPPNFDSDFLIGRDVYFYGAYQWAFYSHIAAGPLTLVVGMVLLSDRFRKHFSKWHRRLGRVQTVLVLLMVTPSGLWMAMHAATGFVAGAGFASLAVVTGLCVWCGWRCAVRRNFAEHRRWMMRCYILLCSAVVLRLTAGFFIVTDVEGDWTYPMNAWSSWLVPLAVFELSALRKSAGNRQPN
jgi:uncharacterized membrane protein